MNDWTPFGHNDPLVSDEERAHRFLNDPAPYDRKGETLYEVRCVCGIAYFGLPSRESCYGWLVTHRSIEQSIAAMAPRGAK